jgi:hypothetical protein
MFKKFSKYYLETCDPENGKVHLEKIIALREKVNGSDFIIQNSFE